MLSENFRVLIVDDETVVGDVLKDFFTMFKSEAQVAKTGSGAIDILKENFFDAVVIDLHLPDMNGEDLILQLYKDYPKMKYFIHTGTIGYQISDTLKQIGITNDFILKKPIIDYPATCSKIIKLCGR